MPYRCPYCQERFATPPPDGHCPACRRVMRVPPPRGAAADRRRRRLQRERIVREGERRRELLRHAPNARALYSPRVIFGFLAVMGVVGSLIVSNARQPSRAGRGELPHRVALRQLDTLATALGRYRFHTGSYPDAQQGLRALVRDPGLEAWLGPYVSGLRDDPWGAPYPYAPPLTNGLPPRLFSCGPDGRPGTPDDLRPDPLAFEVGSDWTSGWVRAAERMPGVRVLLTAPPLPEDAP